MFEGVVAPDKHRMSLRFRVDEFTYLYEKLSFQERDELLQCLLIAAPRGGEAMVSLLEETLLCHAVEELLGGPLQANEGGS